MKCDLPFLYCSICSFRLTGLFEESHNNDCIAMHCILLTHLCCAPPVIVVETLRLGFTASYRAHGLHFNSSVQTCRYNESLVVKFVCFLRVPFVLEAEWDSPQGAHDGSLNDLTLLVHPESVCNIR